MDHALAQFAGELGVLSLGLGKDFNRYSVSGMYGIVPAEISAGPLIETIALRQTYRFYDRNRINFHVGLNFYHVFGLHYDVSRHGQAPDHYYSLGGFRAIVNLGASIKIKDQLSFYVEGGMNDIWIENWIANHEVINPFDHTSLGVGFKYLL